MSKVKRSVSKPAVLFFGHEAIVLRFCDYDYGLCVRIFLASNAVLYGARDPAAEL